MDPRDRPTAMTRAAADGDAEAAAALFPLVYETLRQIAEARMRRERSGHTLQATALVNEAFLKIVDAQRLDARSTTHFHAIASRAMGQVLIDHARGRDAAKRGGGWHRVVLDEVARDLQSDTATVIDVTHAIERLGEEDMRLRRGVELRFFGGLRNAEIAEVLGVSLSTVEADWRLARAWLRRALDSDQSPTEG